MATHIEGMVNIKGKIMVKSNNSEFGGWRSAYRVILLGGVESFIFYGIASNLISFLTMQLGQSTATAAQNVNARTGFMHMLPVLTAYVVGHPSYFDGYTTILLSGVSYLLVVKTFSPCEIVGRRVHVDDTFIEAGLVFIEVDAGSISMTIFEARKRFRTS